MYEQQIENRNHFLVESSDSVLSLNKHLYCRIYVIRLICTQQLSRWLKNEGRNMLHAVDYSKINPCHFCVPIPSHSLKNNSKENAGQNCCTFQNMKRVQSPIIIEEGSIRFPGKQVIIQLSHWYCINSCHFEIKWFYNKINNGRGT